MQTRFNGFDLPEKEIEKNIISYLGHRRIMAWKVESQGTYDEKRGGYRKKPKWFRKGVADILGIYRGKPLAIEVKNQKGKLSKEQLNFLVEFRQNGGIAMVARSIEEVEIQLSLFDEGKELAPLR